MINVVLFNYLNYGNLLPSVWSLPKALVPMVFHPEVRQINLLYLQKNVNPRDERKGCITK